SVLRRRQRSPRCPPPRMQQSNVAAGGELPAGEPRRADGAGCTAARVSSARVRAGGGETAAGVRPRPGSPELDLDLGVRTDAEAVALRRASALYGRRRYRAALAIFRRYRTLEARVGAALSAWPD